MCNTDMAAEDNSITKIHSDTVYYRLQKTKVPVILEQRIQLDTVAHFAKVVQIGFKPGIFAEFEACTRLSIDYSVHHTSAK